MQVIAVTCIPKSLSHFDGRGLHFKPCARSKVDDDLVISIRL